MLINLILERQCNRRSFQTNCMVIRPGQIVRFEIRDAIWIKSMESRLDVSRASRASSERKLKTDETTTPRVIIINRCMGSTITTEIEPEDAYLTPDYRRSEVNRSSELPRNIRTPRETMSGNNGSHHREYRRCHPH